VRSIAIFVSGTGSNAQQLMAHFHSSNTAKVVLLVTNNPKAPALDKARSFGVPTLVLDKKTFFGSEELLDTLRSYRVDFIALAGFLWLVPPYLVEAFQGRMVNIHPALLPRFGGKNMYGAHVHQAVHAAGCKRSGMTIHWVSEHYDEGGIIFQASTPLDPADGPEEIASKVLRLEHAWYAKVVELLL